MSKGHRSARVRTHGRVEKLWSIGVFLKVEWGGVVPR